MEAAKTEYYLKLVEQALHELMQVKEWKDKYGKDEHYLKAQPIAWRNAKLALSELKKSRCPHLNKEDVMDSRMFEVIDSQRCIDCGKWNV